MRVLPASRLWRQERAERFSVRGRRVLPIGPDRSPAITKPFLVGVTVLRDYGSDPLGMAEGEAEACRRAVIKDIYRKPIESDDLGKTINHAGNVVEGVTEFFSRWHVGLTKSRKVRRHDMKSVGKQRDQIAEHVTRTGEAVQ